MKGISIIIPAHNAAARIPQTLRHLAAQTIPDGIQWEVIVVDNGSSDDTAEVTRREWHESGSPTSLQIIEEKKLGTTFAREAGIKAAEYDVLITCDDDNWLASDYLARAFEVISSRPDVGVLIGRPVPKADVELPAWFDKYAMHLTCAPRASESCDISDSKWAAGAGMVLRTKTLRNLMAAGFSQLSPGRVGEQTSAGEDAEVCLWHLLIGQKLWYDDSLVYSHYLEARKLEEDYILGLVRNLSRVPDVTMPYTRVLWGFEYKKSGIVNKLKVFAKLIVKPLLGKNIQAEAVAFLPLTKPLLNPRTRQILESIKKFRELEERQRGE